MEHVLHSFTIAWTFRLYSHAFIHWSSNQQSLCRGKKCEEGGSCLFFRPGEEHTSRTCGELHRECPPPFNRAFSNNRHLCSHLQVADIHKPSKWRGQRRCRCGQIAWSLGLPYHEGSLEQWCMRQTDQSFGAMRCRRKLPWRAILSKSRGSLAQRWPLHAIFPSAALQPRPGDTSLERVTGKLVQWRRQ